MWLFLLFMFVVAAIIFAVAESISGEEVYLCTIGFGALVAITIVVCIVGGISSAKMFNSSKYQKMINIEEADFETDIPKVTETTELTIVDVATAQNVGDRTIGSIENVTWYDVDDEYNLIKYQGEYYRISPLNYGGFFKYNKAKYSGIPGYVLVNTKTQEAKYVELDDPIRYSPSAHFAYKLERLLRNQFPSYMFGKSFFEIDEEGTGYYITSVKRTSIGMFGGKKEETFIVTNAHTGESKEYRAEELPEWIDHAYDLDYLMKIVDYNLLYVKGWWNSFTSKTGVNATSYKYAYSDFAGYNTAITSNGDIVFYTGVTPVNKAETNIGFILANPRTGKISYYECAGAEESSAQSAAESLVQNLGYSATFPTILNVDGMETYFMLLKDKAGLVQRYALCNIENYSKVVQAEDFETALKLYREKIGTIDSVTDISGEVLKTEGIIKKLYQAQIDGSTFYYFMLESDNTLYMSSIKNSNKQVLLTEGSKVYIEYVNSSEEGVCIVKKIQF